MVKKDILLTKYNYPTYLKTDGKKVADQKRKLYKARHNCEDKISKQVAGYYGYIYLQNSMVRSNK